MHYEGIVKALWPLLMVAALAVTTASRAEGRRRYLMAALGDSITAGTFADSKAKAPEGVYGEPQTPETRIPWLGNKENKLNLSWATGKEIFSHASLLAEYLLPGAVDLRAVNFSVPGEKAEGMEHQALELVTWAKSGDYDSVKYVTFFIGANDACQKTPIHEFSRDLAKAFAKIAEIEQDEPVRILVPSLPRIPDLGRREIADMRTALNYTCRYLRDKLLKMCPELTLWNTEEEHRAKVEHTRRYLVALESSVEAARRAHPSLDLHFSDRLWEEEIRPGDLAADCFHPNFKAHERMSRELWKEQPWFR